MNIRTSDLNFKGRYVLRGKTEFVNRAATTIKNAKKDEVEFFPITSKDNRIVVVATNNDAQTLKIKKQHPSFIDDIKSLAGEKKFVSNLFKYIFGTDSDALVIQGDNLAKFGVYKNKINFENGASLSQFKTAEYFVDGTVKKYTLHGRLCEINHPDGSQELIAPNGTRTISTKDGEVTVIPVKRGRWNTSSGEVTVKAEEVKKEVIKPSPVFLQPTFKEQETPSVVHKEAVLDIYDSQGRIKKQILDDNLEANYFYKGKTNEVSFIYYSNGQFETDIGIVDYQNQTIELPYRDGIRQILDKEGKLKAFIFPDGTKKYYDQDENITHKILPDGTKEIFNEKGRMYLRILPNGEKEYTRPLRQSTFSA